MLFRKKVACRVCPHNCRLSDGDVGKCLIRINRDGAIINDYEGVCSHLSVEPIEKRPFFHFLPGSKFLSVGLYGCNFRCRYCQNHTISQNVKRDDIYSPDALIDLALQKKVKGIVFTFNEPTIHYEYVSATALKAEVAGLFIAIKSNGYVSMPILQDLNANVDAWNIDIKGDKKEYIKTCQGKVKPVLDSIAFLSKAADHLEISYLVSPNLCGNTEFHVRTRNWLYDLSADIPIHLLYLYPCHKMGNPTNKSSLLHIYDIFREKMNYVYISNLYDANIARRHTKCPICKSTLIYRSPLPNEFQVSCCGNNIKGIFA